MLSGNCLDILRSMSTKFILHGGFTRKDNEQNRSFFRELVKDVEDGGIVLMVFFASREDDPAGTFVEMKERIAAESGGKELRFVYAMPEEFMTQLEAASAVYLHGGSTNKLLRILRTYPELVSLLDGKTVAGSSAGAYAIAKWGSSHSEDTMREGLGLVPLRVVCHYESLELPPAAGATKLLTENFPELELVMLKDCEWKVFVF